MELDKRIKSLKSIRSFNTDNSDCSGKFGYFTNFIDNFDNLDDVCKGTCVFEKGGSFPFYAIKTDSLENRKFQFFIPEEDLLPKPKEKKFRPYTIAEFQNIFKPGYPVRFRPKDQSESEEMLLIFNGYKTIQGAVFVYFGHFAYTLNQLFEDYEWQKHYTDDYKPFGVEE